MITTVTTTTTAILTTVTAASLTLLVILALIALLIKKELIGGMSGARARQFSRALNIAIAPLLIVFAATVLIKLVDMMP